MALLFEFCFYAGLLLVASALLWGLALVFRRRWSKLAVPGLWLLVGVVLMAAPSFVSRRMEVDLGPRDTMVSGERHLTLTGWNGDGYDFLANQNDVVVLQMANGDVTDQTLESLAGMTRLRELDLNDSQVTDDGMATLQKLPNLRTLRIRATEVTDAGLSPLLDPSTAIRQLDVRETQVSEALIEQWKLLGDDRRALQ